MKKITLFLLALVAVSTVFSGCDLDGGNGSGGDPQTVAQPTAVQTGNKVALSTTTSGATIYYTTNGTEPTTGSSLYSAPVVVKTGTNVKAIAVKTGWNASGVFGESFTAVYNRVTDNSDGTLYTIPNAFPSLGLNEATFAILVGYQSGTTLQDEPNVICDAGNITFSWID